jgi:hypothetical protein
MDEKAKREFVQELCTNVCNSLLERSNRWPKHWNGINLRQLVAHAFDAQCNNVTPKQAKDTLNEIIVRNLI